MFYQLVILFDKDTKINYFIGTNTITVVGKIPLNIIENTWLCLDSTTFYVNG